jgi:transposase
MATAMRLTNRQWDDLDHLRNATGSADVVRNCSIIWRSDGGHGIAGIAQLLGGSPETVQRIRRLYREGGREALAPKRPPGRPSRATPTFREALAEALATNPQTLGSGFATWSAARLAAHLARVTGITLSAAQVRRLLHAEGFSVHRPKHTRKGKRDEAAYQKAKAHLRRLKKKALAKGAPEALVFQDEVESHRLPALARVWARVGTQPEVPTPGTNEKKVVYGGIDYATGQTTDTVADTKSGVNFLAFLVALVAAYAGRKVRLVCDNGRFHPTKAVRAWLAAHRDQVAIFWLPPYCPSLNLIERLWGHLKRTVLAHVWYTTLDDLVTAFRRGLDRIHGHKDRMGFMFNHDDLRRRKPGKPFCVPT